MSIDLTVHINSGKSIIKKCKFFLAKEAIQPDVAAADGILVSSQLIITTVTVQSTVVNLYFQKYIS